MNDRGSPRRSGGADRGRRRAQLHPRRDQAWDIAVGAGPDDQRLGNARRHPPAEPDDTQCVADAAGERLLQRVVPRIKEIGAALAATSELRQKPAGLIRLTATENAAEAVLWPAIRKLIPEYPDIKVEVVIDYGLTDIVAEQVDAGVRFGETVAKDMIAVPIGPRCGWPSSARRTISRGARRRGPRAI
jgi:hypothetical protein